MGSPGSLGLIMGLTGVMGGAQENLMELPAPIVGGSRAAWVFSKKDTWRHNLGGTGSGKAEGADGGVRACYPGQGEDCGVGQTAEADVGFSLYLALMCAHSHARARERQTENATELERFKMAALGGEGRGPS